MKLVREARFHFCLSPGEPGFNNLVARMVHKACGYRDLDYLELKLRHRSVMR